MKRNAQSLSICVPGKKCVNQCKFCVSCMHADAYKNQMDENLPFYDLYLEDYVRRMIFAKENDANIMMITEAIAVNVILFPIVLDNSSLCFAPKY